MQYLKLNIPKVVRVILGQRSLFLTSNKLANNSNLTDEPVKYSTSKAKTWDSINSFTSKTTRTQPTSQPFIVALSTFIFLAYFILIREENALDKKVSRPLEESVPDIKEMTLKHQILQYEQMGLNTRELREALRKEIELKKKANK
ncbi:hypothetical protein BpHYR1_047356 [Brachionus plicatilis]|uniref:Uncharacterized protein n=1 Tax=Brachionus plicatilis TaxID=10195 RepID=A0A3M7RTW1_BRAPC|nr:hypothetical protein BpHYR1_047356 [Brachionus plicatilis]